MSDKKDLTLAEVLADLKVDLDTPMRYISLSFNSKLKDEGVASSSVVTRGIDILTFLHQHIEIFFDHIREVKDKDLMRATFQLVWLYAKREIEDLDLPEFERNLKKHGFLDEEDDDGTVS